MKLTIQQNLISILLITLYLIGCSKEVAKKGTFQVPGQTAQSGGGAASLGCAAYQNDVMVSCMEFTSLTGAANSSLELLRSNNCGVVLKNTNPNLRLINECPKENLIASCFMGSSKSSSDLSVKNNYYPNPTSGTDPKEYAEQILQLCKSMESNS